MKKKIFPLLLMSCLVFTGCKTDTVPEVSEEIANSVYDAKAENGSVIGTSIYLAPVLEEYADDGFAEINYNYTTKKGIVEVPDEEDESVTNVQRTFKAVIRNNTEKYITMRLNGEVTLLTPNALEHVTFYYAVNSVLYTFFDSIEEALETMPNALVQYTIDTENDYRFNSQESFLLTDNPLFGTIKDESFVFVNNTGSDIILFTFESSGLENKKITAQEIEAAEQELKDALENKDVEVLDPEASQKIIDKYADAINNKSSNLNLYLHQYSIPTNETLTSEYIFSDDDAYFWTYE